MKINFLIGFFLIGASGLTWGQQKSGTAARTAAIMSYEEYVPNPMLKDKLDYALKNIIIACEDAKTADDPSTWRYKGMISAAVALDDQLSPKYKTVAADAYTAYEKALSMEEAKAEVKGKTKDKIAAKQEFIDGFTQTGRALYRQGSLAFNEQNYEGCFNMYSKLIEIPVRTAVFDTKKKISLTFEAAGNEVVDMLVNASYLGGVAAVKLSKMDEAEKMLRPLIAGKKIKEEDIKSCFRVLSSGYLQLNKVDKAKAIVAEGRKMYPTDFDMLITEINIALQEGRLAELEDELNQAVKADPNNVLLHFVMGNMYDELFRSKVNYEKWPVADENLKQGKIFFDKSVEWYKSGLKIDPKHFNSMYSLGAIHVNFSNYYATLNKNSEKLKKEERKVIETEYLKFVDAGLDFLLQAEKIDPNDLGLVRGLKEVYTRKSDEANYLKYSAREKELLKKGGQ